MDENAKLLSLVDKKRKGFTELKAILLAIRNHDLKISDATLETGMELLRKYKSKLGNDYFLVVEEVLYASLDCQQYYIADQAMKILGSKFSNNDKIVRMKGILAEATGSEEDAGNIYDSILNDNLLDMETRKRKIALLRISGRKSDVITELNKYLEMNMGDPEAWLELADIYLESLNYTKAVFCYEELVMLFPKNLHYFLKLAEIYYTIGGSQNLLTARSYYSFILSRNTDNYRAFWGLYQTCKTIASQNQNQKKSDPKNQELLELCSAQLKEFYETKKLGSLIKDFNFCK